MNQKLRIKTPHTSYFILHTSGKSGGFTPPLECPTVLPRDNRRSGSYVPRGLMFRGQVAGFTLVEMIVAVSVFMVVMVAGIGALVSMNEANRKTQALRTVMDNLNFSLENMARSMRVGVDYHCGATGTVTSPRDCATDGDSFISFTDSSGDRIIFRLNNARIERSNDLGATYLGITAPEIAIEKLTFYVKGSLEGDGLQPKILIIARGVAGAAEGVRTTFSVQTLVSQRLRDS